MIETLGRRPNIVRDSNLYQVAIERKLVSAKMDDRLKAGESTGGRGINYRDAFIVPASATELRSCPGKIARRIGPRVGRDTPEGLCHA